MCLKRLAFKAHFDSNRSALAPSMANPMTATIENIEFFNDPWYFNILHRNS